MDPAFVQHSIVDLTTRVAGYLVFILAYASMVWGGVHGIFRMFKVSLEGWADEVAIAVVGILGALMMDWNMWFYVAGLTETQFVLSHAARGEMGSPSAWFPPDLVLLFGNITTGALVVAGKRTIVGIAESFGDGVRSIQDAVSNRAKREE